MHVCGPTFLAADRPPQWVYAANPLGPDTPLRSLTEQGGIGLKDDICNGIPQPSRDVARGKRPKKFRHIPTPSGIHEHELEHPTTNDELA